MSTYLPSEFVLPPRYLWNSFNIFFTTCHIIVEVTLISYPHAFPLSLQCTQSSLKMSLWLRYHWPLPQALFTGHLSAPLILSPPPSWSPSPKWFDPWLFSLLFLSTLPFSPTGSLLEYSYISQLLIAFYIQVCPKNFRCINEHSSQKFPAVIKLKFQLFVTFSPLLNCSYPLGYSSRTFSVTLPPDMIRSPCDMCYFREIITV